MNDKNPERRTRVASGASFAQALLFCVAALAPLLFVAACGAGTAGTGGVAGSAGAAGNTGSAKGEGEIAEGSTAPDFALPSDDGQTVKLSSYRGKQPVVLYFYPKDETPGCTKEACSFRDNLAEFKKAGVEILGVSVDSVEAHQKFRQKENLNFTLLSDEKKEVTKQYGVLGTFGVASRVTFVIDKAGTVRKIYRDVSPAEHAAEVLAFAKTLA
jgi:peroxiredoxin Q/BCP